MTFSTWHNTTRIAIRLYSGKLLLTFVFLGGSDAAGTHEHRLAAGQLEEDGKERLAHDPLAWRPHSVFSLPRHRPARGASPEATGVVHGMQPMLG